MTSTDTAPALTADSVRTFAAAWYQALDRHDDIETILPLMVDDGLRLVFPEATKYGHQGFREWYVAVTNRFFDEVHTLKEATITASTGDSAEVKVVVNWRAKIWNPPAARSEWLGFDAYQSWTVVRGADGPQVKTYVVDELRPMPGSASL
jgi:hypothetical protein